MRPLEESITRSADYSLDSPQWLWGFPSQSAEGRWIDKPWSINPNLAQIYKETSTHNRLRRPEPELWKAKLLSFTFWNHVRDFCVVTNELRRIEHFDNIIWMQASC